MKNYKCNLDFITSEIIAHKGDEIKLKENEETKKLKALGFISSLEIVEQKETTKTKK